MRIAVISGVFPKVSETFVLRHITGLSALGHQVDIYSDYPPRDDEYPKRDDLMAAMRARTTYMDTPPLKTGQRLLAAPLRIAQCAQVAPRLTLQALNPWEFGRQALSLSQVNRLYTLARVRQRYDIIHAHFGMVGDRFRFASALWNAPLVVSFHGFDYSLWPRQHGRDCYRRLFQTAALIVVNSEHTRAQVAALGCPESKIAKVYASWDMARFAYHPRARAASEPFRVLSVARLVEKKGIDDGLRAIAYVRGTYPGIRYDIIGSGPMRPELESLIRQLGLDEIVTLHGAQSSDYVRRMMDEAHAFLLPSRTARSGDEEGLGVALLEAQAAGLPVVATTHGPFPEVVLNGETGFLAPERAPGELARHLITLIQQPDVARRMGYAGRQHVEARFDPAGIDRQHETLYQRIIETRQVGALTGQRR